MDEPSRSAALHSYMVLDSPREEEFDDIAKLAAEVCGTPIAVVNLVDTYRQFFKAEVGLGVRETPLETSFCGHAILAEDMMVVNDASKDPRFDGNPLVHTEGGLRFYAGAILKAPGGLPIGTVCVLDTVPRDLDDHQIRTLKLLARQVMTQLELRRSVAHHASAAERLSALMELGERLRPCENPAEMGSISGEIVARTLKVTRAGFGRLRSESRSITIDGDWVSEGQVSVAGTHEFGDHGPFSAVLRQGQNVVFEDARTDALPEGVSAFLQSIDVMSMINVPVVSNGKTIAIFFAHDRAPRAWSPSDVDFVRSVADRVQLSMDRLNARKDQEVLNQELSHRLKNTLAMVQALATQTLRPVTDRQAVDAFTQRIGALSRAHDVLLNQNWSEASVRDVTAAVLSTFDRSERFTLLGPNLRMGPRATLSLSLVLHELATNALKYGAVSVPEGRVSVEWQVEPGEIERTFVLRWTEKGGPPVYEPAERGFGSRLIRMGLIGTGGVDISYEHSGLVARMQAPLSQMQQA
ncbi:sensor histidine kinase [Pararhizobium haloflavum]|uniref:sensor histidine kinase n=1 Tax=Pararhizobium haloflavum TaxID=2037914 RepID=UPI000C17A741|nr:GAF domain-containing protein [Pararhizobium haloflavum]